MAEWFLANTFEIVCWLCSLLFVISVLQTFYIISSQKTYRKEIDFWQQTANIKDDMVRSLYNFQAANEQKVRVVVTCDYRAARGDYSYFCVQIGNEGNYEFTDLSSGDAYMYFDLLNIVCKGQLVDGKFTKLTFNQQHTGGGTHA